MKAHPIARLLFSSLLSLALVGPAVAQTLKIATLAPDGSAWMRELRAAAAEVKAGTGGRVDVKFFPGGVMGNDAVVLRKMRLGGLLDRGPVSLRHREIAILRTTGRLGSEYEWGVHVSFFADRAELSEAQRADTLAENVDGQL